jgi:transketolase
VRDVFIKRLEHLAAANPKVFFITGDLGFGVIDRYAEKFPRQFLNAGVAEQNMTGLATGLALEGRVVYTYSIGNFPTLRCLEQLRNDAAYHDANVKVVCIGGGFSYGPLGMSHHAMEDLAIMRALSITTVAPGCDWEAAEATEALAAHPGTCYLRLDKSSAGNTERPNEKFVLGKSRVLRDGTDVTLIVAGGILGVALNAADEMAAKNVSCRVVSMHTVHPLDTEAVLSAARDTGGIVTVEEHTVRGGLGSAVAETCMDAGVAPAAFKRVAFREGLPSIVGSQTYLRKRYGMDERAVTAAIECVVRGAAGVHGG